MRRLSCCFVAAILAANGCKRESSPAPADSGECLLVRDGFGPAGEVPVTVERVVAGLEVPWALAFLPGGSLLVTERPGRVRLVEDGALVEEPVATLPVAAAGEGGLLGLTLHPDFASNRLFYLYLTVSESGRLTNRVERWRLAPDARSASFDKRILDGIPGARVHDGGRLHFHRDGMLYVSTGETGQPSLTQAPDSLGGKLLRLTPEGDVPADNPFAGSPVFLLGIRNSQGFAWRDAKTLYVVDHGPSGELGRRGRDEVNVARAGDNLGWPTIHACEQRQGMVAPSLTWEQAAPPGGAAVYTGAAIPEWRGNLIVATLGSRHLHRVAFDPQNPRQVALHEVYLQGEPPQGYGRLREAIMGPDGELYVTTSNCDGRGSCPPEKDQILRITRR
ncbi:MAG: PQQ-dependent sugar dehydrogenase [Myxococcales bacterium]|jgi:glucose/arabinose dehydrogenase